METTTHHSILLSVAIIARNEEHFIEECIASVRPYADEIVIADTGSADRTEALAAAAGALVFRHPWKGDFSEARNAVLERCSGRWILSIDADERLRDAEGLRTMLEEANPAVAAFRMGLFSPASAATPEGGGYWASVPRLFRNIPAIRFRGAMHESVEAAVAERGYTMAECTGAWLLHLGYSGDRTAKAEQHRKRLDAALENAPDDSYMLWQRGKAALALNKPEEALHYFAQAQQSPLPDSARALIYSWESLAYLRAGKHSEARHRASLALSIENRVLPLVVLTESYEATEEYEQAGRTAVSALDMQIARDDIQPNRGHLYFVAGRAEWIKGNAAQAVAYWEQGGNDIGCLVGRAQHHRKSGQPETTVALLQQAVAAAPDNGDLRQMLEVAHRELANTAPKPQYNTADSRPLLSVVMIVKNERHFLPGCIESVQEIADEIIINDTGSTDGTQQLATELGATVFETAWEGDFSKARNAALERATGRWVLYIDADERLAAGQAEALRTLLENTPPSVGAWVVHVISPHRQPNGTTETHVGYYPRIFRNLGYPAVQFEGAVHEQISPSILAAGLGISKCDIAILHLGYDQGRDIMQQKIKRNYDLLLKQIQQSPENATAWLHLGFTLANMGVADQARHALEFALSLDTLQPHLRASAYASLAQMYGNDRKFADALAMAEQSLRYAPGQAYALHLKAYALLYMKRYTEAEQCFTEVLNRLENKSSAAAGQTGYDVDIDRAAVNSGLAMARGRRAPVA